MGFLTENQILKNLDHFVMDAEDRIRLRARKKGTDSKGASIDLALGDEVYLSGDNHPSSLSQSNPYVTIPRGQFALLLTKETLVIPDDYLALISMRFSIKSKGLINISGFHVDPGFKGKIVFSVYNAGPQDVLLKYGDPVFMIFFYRLDSPAIAYDGQRQNQRHLPPDMVASVQGTSASLVDLERRTANLEVKVNLFIGLLIAVVATIIGLVVSRGS